jgi:hypothetical protein
MTSIEKRWLTFYSFGVLLVTTTPYLIGFWLQGSEFRFAGFLTGLEDGNSYIAKMMLGASGDWLFRTPYTAYPQNGFLAFLPYILLGKLAAAPGLHDQMVALFQLFRLVSGFCMIWATYQFIAHFIDEVRYRRLGVALVTIGGGLGWLAFVGLQPLLWGDRIPLEFYSPETFGFLSIFALPHLAMGRALLLWGLLAYWKAYQEPISWKRILAASFLWLGLGLMQPLTVLIGWMLIVMDISIRWFLNRKDLSGQELNFRQGMIQGAGLLVCSAPVVVYTVFSFLTDPFLTGWAQQNIILSPPPGDYLLAYGLAIPFLYWGFRKLLHSARAEDHVLLLWIVLLPILAYFPYNLQRRIPEGIWTAICIVMLVGVAQLSRKWQTISRRLVYSCFLITVLYLLGVFMTVFQVKEPLYRPEDEVQTFLYLQAHAAGYPVVLASFDTANALPAWAAVRTPIGHGPESISLKAVQPKVEQFYQAETSDARRTEFVDEFKVAYVIWGPRERKIGSWNLDSSSWLKPVYQNATYQVFEVVR